MLRSEFDLDFTYTRTYGPVLSQFFSALKHKKLRGIRAKNGLVLCPPQEYDPVTSEDLSEWVDLGNTGVLSNWCWVETPLAKHPLDYPFAWGMIKIDGADSLMIHAVAVNDRAQLRQGLRLKPIWREQRLGTIRDIICFEPE